MTVYFYSLPPGGGRKPSYWVTVAALFRSSVWFLLPCAGYSQDLIQRAFLAFYDVIRSQNNYLMNLSNTGRKTAEGVNEMCEIEY